MALCDELISPKHWAATARKSFFNLLTDAKAITKPVVPSAARGFGIDMTLFQAELWIGRRPHFIALCFLVSVRKQRAFLSTIMLPHLFPFSLGTAWEGSSFATFLRFCLPVFAYQISCPTVRRLLGTQVLSKFCVPNIACVSSNLKIALVPARLRSPCSSEMLWHVPFNSLPSSCDWHVVICWCFFGPSESFHCKGFLSTSTPHTRSALS